MVVAARWWNFSNRVAVISDLDVHVQIRTAHIPRHVAIACGNRLELPDSGTVGLYMTQHAQQTKSNCAVRTPLVSELHLHHSASRTHIFT